MRSTSLFSLFGIALCMSAAVVACSSGDDDTAAPATKSGGIGESCTRSADCSGTNVCVDQICQKKGTMPGGAGDTGTGGTTGGTGGSSGGTGGSKAGTGGTGGGKAGSGTGATGGTVVVPAPVLGGEGESCTRRADCEEGLGCFNQRCAPDGSVGNGGQGGGGNPPPPTPTLGQLGETCILPSDCATGLSCLPLPPYGFASVCQYKDTGITATGKSCSAECKVANDCCQLPLAITEGVNTNPFRSCADLDDILANTDCADPGTFAKECFLQATYCNCKASTWKCSDEGQCQYAVTCTADGLDTEGCPTYTRGERALVATCNDDGKCASAPIDPSCTADADCDTMAIVDGADTGGADTCSPGECTCYKPTGYCYRKCTAALDCKTNQTCDTKIHLCVDGPECTVDLNCQAKNGDVRQICLDGKCAEGCTNDLDCNGGTITGELSSVCGADHTCKPIGCTQDAECTTETGVQLFCVDNVTAAPGTVVHSAITDGKE